MRMRVAKVRICKISLSNGDCIVKNPCGIAKTNNSCPPSCASPAASKKGSESVREGEKEREGVSECEFRGATRVIFIW